MKRNRLFTAICLAAATLLTACTQDELAEPGNTLPDGAYPLQIGRVSITAESSAKPWTRVAENETDGMGSHWTGGECIGVRIGDNEETGLYIINVDDAGNVTVTPETPVYWKSTRTAEVTAWYPATDGAVNLRNQDRNGLTYVLHGIGTGDHQTPVTLSFTHQLAKVRVVTKGTARVGGIDIHYNPVSCNIRQGKIIQDMFMKDRVPMRQTTCQDGTECWEANVVPGEEIQYIIVTNKNLDISHSCEISPNITPEAGKVHTITITANSEGTQTIDLSTLTDTREIADNGTYYVTGTGQYGIRVTGGGKPDIHLEDARISVSSGNAISITGGTPTIHVKGNDNEVSSSDGAGIYVAENSTVTITGSSRSDVLTVTGNNGSSGIGGYVIDDNNHQSANSGNINIENVTLYAYSSSPSTKETVSPGLGSTGNATCQSITIDNAAVHAYGCGGTNWSAPAIGNGMDWMGNTASSTPTVTISNNSEVHAHRGERNGRSFADYIGRAGTSSFPYSDVIATVDASSVVYKYTGNGNTPDE